LKKSEETFKETQPKAANEPCIETKVPLILWLGQKQDFGLEKTGKSLGI